MNILLWVLQVLLAFLYIAGGAYKLSKPEDLVNRTTVFSSGVWRAVGVLEMLGGVLLVVPASLTGMPMLTVLAAGALALETLAVAAIYARKSVKLVAANPLVFAAPMALVAALVALGRYALIQPS